MAMAALLSGSTLGSFGGLVGWLFLGLTGAQAFLLYLCCGLVVPMIIIVLATSLGGRLPGHATEKTASSAPSKAQAA